MTYPPRQFFMRHHIFHPHLSIIAPKQGVVLPHPIVTQLMQQRRRNGTIRVKPDDEYEEAEREVEGSRMGMQGGAWYVLLLHLLLGLWLVVLEMSWLTLSQ